MPFINLIESQLIAQRKLEQQLRTSRMAMVAAGVVCAAGYGFLMLKSGEIAGEEAQLKANIAKVKKTLDEVAKLEKNREQLEPRLWTLQDAQLLTGRWGRILSHLTTNTPSTAWITGVRAVATDPEKPINISFVGVGKTQKDASEFMLRCQNSPELEGVSLRYTQEKILDKAKGIEFEVGADIVGTAERKPIKKTEEGGSSGA